jgi:hypothetical protein
MTTKDRTWHPRGPSADAQIRALLDGTKTQLRLPMRPQPIHRVVEGLAHVTIGMDPAADGAIWYDADGKSPGRELRSPFGRIGDLLSVRERHWFRESDGITAFADGSLTPHPTSMIGAKNIKPDKPPEDDWPNNATQYGFKCKSATQMPAWASRLTLLVLDVRVERVQDISEADAQAEGVEFPAPYSGVGGKTHPTCIDAFRVNWDATWRKTGFGWDANPWVWVGVVRRSE